MSKRAKSGWYPISYPLWFSSKMQYVAITLHDDSANDVAWRYMGAGDMAIANSSQYYCGY